MAWILVIRPTGLPEPSPLVVTNRSFGTISDDPPASGVTIGDNPLGDSDDATYIETQGGEGNTAGAEWVGYFPLPQTTVPAGWYAGWVLLRYTQLPGEGFESAMKTLGIIDSTETANVEVTEDPRWGQWSGASGNYNTVTVNHQFGGDYVVLQSIADSITAGSAGIGLHMRGTPHRIHEVWMQFFYHGDPPRPRALVAPPRRLTQRGDGVAGGAPRLTGSRSRQASNRLLGGYL